MSKKFLFLISFVLLVGLAAPAAADELIASYEPNEYPDLSILLHSARDPTLTVTRVQSGTGGAPTATDGNYLLKWVWINEPDDSDGKLAVEIEHKWATKTFDLAGYNLITADVWYDEPNAQPTTIGIWNMAPPPAPWPDGVFWAGALEVPYGLNQWHTVEMDIGAAHAYWDGKDLSDLFSFKFEDLGGRSGVLYTDNMWLRFVRQVQAWGPIPFHKAVSMDPNVDLSWEPGIDANSHDVYFGTRFADVNDANRSSGGIFKGNQPLADANYDPGTLERLTTYYWRIDEVNEADPNVWKGDVWRFKTVPVKYVEIPLVSYEDSENSKYDVWTGINTAGDYDLSLVLGDQLVGGGKWGDINVPPATDGNNVLGLKWTYEQDLEVEHGCTFENSVPPFTYDLDGIDEMVFDVYYDYNNAAGGFNPLPHTINVWDWRFAPTTAGSSNLPTTRGEWHTIVIDVSHLHNTGLNGIYDFMFAAHGEDFDPNGADPNNWGALMFMDNLRLRYYLTEFASGPDPADKATDVPRQLTLTWLPGVYAADVNGHKVYFDPDKQKVTDRSGCDVNGVSTTDPCYPLPTPPAPLDLGQTYYWRVDEVNNAGPDPCFWPGDVWSFTTSNYIVVENFDSYADTAALRAVWKKGATRATVSLNTDPNYVHNGNNSMRYYYDNYYIPYYSEAYVDIATLPSGIGSDWNAGGVKALALYFYGQADNDANEQMYVKLTDGGSPAKTAKVTYGDNPDEDPNYVKDPKWHEWNIDLQDFVDDNNVNLANVSRITIRFGDGIDPSPALTPAGTVYFDDIRLYIPRCMPGTVPDSASGNCLIDYPDLQILTNNWLISEYDVVPVEPNNNNLIGWWKLDETSGAVAADSSVNGNDGTMYGDPNWGTAGQIGTAIDFNGVNDYVDCANNVSLNEPNITGKITLAVWVKTNDCGNNEFNPYIAKGDHAYTLQHRYVNNINDLEIAIYSAGAWYWANTPVDSSFNGVWHHLAGTYNGSQLKLYIDGELKATTDYVGSIASETANVNLGRSSEYTDRLYEGALDDVRIYGRALSQDEVASLAGKPAGIPFTQPLYLLLTPQNPGINLYNDGTIDFRDYAVLAGMWLEEVLWP